MSRIKVELKKKDVDSIRIFASPLIMNRENLSMFYIKTQHTFGYLRRGPGSSGKRTECSCSKGIWGSNFLFILFYDT